MTFTHFTEPRTVKKRVGYLKKKPYRADKHVSKHFASLNPFPPKNALVLTCLKYKSFENTVGKGEIALNEQFLLFPQCFLPVWRTFGHFHQI